ncbi:hypothetical protein, partial [Flavobacterium sp. LHD-85]|uniref:hypothetical protein n=1 Tax=Flavobacterium sp. LHD-85 TaxID=3071410 RepID=UPI0027E1A71E
LKTPGFPGRSSENRCHSPDRSGNPSAFFFKKQKIGAHSGIKLLINIKIPIFQIPNSKTRCASLRLDRHFTIIHQPYIYKYIYKY